eukprot:1474224-Pyramimonas_sp.AAC.1
MFSVVFMFQTKPARLSDGATSALPSGSNANADFETTAHQIWSPHSRAATVALSKCRPSSQETTLTYGTLNVLRYESEAGAFAETIWMPWSRSNTEMCPPFQPSL